MVGLGTWARNILKSVPPSVRIESIVTKRSDASALAPPDAAVVRDLGGLGFEDFDGIIVTNEASKHVSTLRAVWNAAPWMPVFIEKPVAMIYAELQSLAADFPSAMLLVDHIQLFNENLRVITNGLADARLATITGVDQGRGPVRGDCSALWDYGPHAVSIALELCGGGNASGMTRVTNATARAHAGRARITFDLEMDSGTTAHLCVANDGEEKKRRYVATTAEGVEHVFDGLAATEPPPLSNALAVFCDAIVEGAPPNDDARWGWELPLEVTRLLSDVEGMVRDGGVTV
jgi:predicted dehydrogenase